MYKNHNWNQKQLSTALEKVYKQLGEHFHLYKLREDILFPHGMKSDDAYITNTISSFERSHACLPSPLKASKSFFKKIRSFDTIVSIEEEKILLHSYKLMLFISKYLHLFSIYLDGSYKKSTFAYFKGDSAKFMDKYKKHRSRLTEIDCISKGPDLVLAFVYKQLCTNQELMDTFLNQCTLIPMHQIKDLNNSSSETRSIGKLVEFLGSTNFSSSKPIYKSLGIILVSYLVHKLKMKNTDAVSAVNTLFDDLFFDFTGEYYQINISANRLLENVYITGRLDSEPIFASNDEDNNYSENTFNRMEKIYEQGQSELGIDLSVFDYKKFSPLNNLPSIYLDITPIELLQPYV